jgi:CIC family chloride channel protein
MTLAGAGVGCCALLVPEVMGIGYDTVNSALLGDLGVTILLMILIFKLLATAISVGFNLPAGLIGPTFFIGAIAGSVTGQVTGLFPVMVSSPGLYAMLGMGAMMGATLQAPLAALLALLELTANQNIIFPGMLAIISANLAARELFGQDSIYLSQMRGEGLDYRNDPVAQSLRRLGVTSVMNTQFAIVIATVYREQAQKILSETPHWLIISKAGDNLLMPAADLARYLEESEDEEINLLEIPAKRRQLAPVQQQATLHQALMILDESKAEALYVIQPIGTSADRIYGVVTRQDIEENYRLQST